MRALSLNIKPMVKLKTNNAITLLEVTVGVLVLTFVSLIFFKKFVTLIEFSRCREAIENISVIHQSMEFCYLSRGSYSSCSDFTALNIPDPNSADRSHFKYQIISGDHDEFTIVATRTTLDEGVPTDTITFKKDASGGITRLGTGAFSGIH